MKRFSMAMTWLALAGLMTTVSCRKPVVGFTNGEARTVTVSAVTENGDGSKTSIDGLYVKWSENDQIKMNAESVLTLTEGAGSTMGRFAGEVKGDDGPYRIGYPAGKTTYDGETLKLNIPASWAYDADMKEIVPMVAYAADVDDDVQFRNAVNMLKLQLKGDGTEASNMTSIVLTSTESNLSGDIEVTFDGEGNPTFNAITEGEGVGNTMTVSFGAGLQLGNTVQCVYIPLAKINGGDLTVRFDCANGRFMEKKVTADANFNGVNNMLSDELTVNATDKDHEAVNFGTPNLKWSKYNLGVDPDDLDAAEDWYGDYYQWGGVTPVTSTGINVNWENYPFTNDIYSDGNKKVFTKYIPTGMSEYWDGDGDPDNKTVLDLEDDAARAAWGGDWRMPTSAEWEALYANNTFEWLDECAESEKVSGFKAVAAGYLVVKGGKESVELDPSVYMFLPAAGYRYGTSLNDAGSDGYYWSSSLDSSHPHLAYSMHFYSSKVDPQYSYKRHFGVAVRPVR